MQLAPFYCVKHTQCCKRHLAPPLYFWLYQHTHFPFIQNKTTTTTTEKAEGGRINEPHEAPPNAGRRDDETSGKAFNKKHKIYMEKKLLLYGAASLDCMFVLKPLFCCCCWKMSIILYWRNKKYQNPIQYSKRCAWCWISLDFPLDIPKKISNSHNERANNNNNNKNKYISYIYIYYYCFR